MYLLSTPSSAGSLLRPPPPDGLAATEPGLLRLPPPSPAAADRPATPRPAREHEGEEPAEVARLLLRLLLLLPPPPSAFWVALSMIAARPRRGWPLPPPQLLPPLLQLRAPGPRVAAPIPREMPDSYRRKRRRRERGLGRKPATQPRCSCGRPSSRLDLGPAPPSSHFSGKFGAQVPPPPVARPLRSLWARAGDAPGADQADRVGTPHIGALRPSLSVVPTPIPRGDGGKSLQVLLSTLNPPRDLEGGTAQPTLSTRIWTRPVPNTSALLAAHRSLGQARTQSPEN